MEAELPLGWTSHVAPTGHIYYYNASTKKSTYKRPSEESAILKELPNEAQIAAIEGQLDNKGAEQTVAAVTRTDKTLRRDKTDRPKDKIHIPGIEPWIQVHTKAGRRFYHNQDTSESYWTVPDAIVDLVNAWEQGDDELGSQAQSEAGFHPEYEYEEQPAEEPDQQQPASPTALRTEFDEDDIAWQLAALEEAGEGLIQTPDEDMVELSLQEKMSIFKIMLSDRQVDPFRTWDLELPKIASDPRYLVLDSTRQRKAVFEEYCTDQAKEKQERQASTLKVDPTIAFLRLLSRSIKKTPYFQDFKRKHKKDNEYKAYGNSDHEREKLFRSFADHKKLSTTQQEAALVAILKAGKSDPLTDVTYHVLEESHAQSLMTKFGGA